MTKDEICGLLRQIHDVLAMQSETNQVKPTSDYERGVIDGMLKQAESSVDKAVNAMAKRPWAGLTDEEVAEILCDDRWQMRPELMLLGCQAKLKEKNI